MVTGSQLVALTRTYQLSGLESVHINELCAIRHAMGTDVESVQIGGYARAAVGAIATASDGPRRMPCSDWNPTVSILATVRAH